MSRLRSRLLAALAILVALPVATRAQGADNDNATAIVLRAARVYKNLSGLQADFRQRLIDDAPGMGTRDSRGTIYQSGSTKFAMRWSDPAGDAMVVDGQNLWVYVSDYPKEVKKYPMPTGPVYGANFMGYFLENAEDRYRMSYVKSEVGRRRAVRCGPARTHRQGHVFPSGHDLVRPQRQPAAQAPDR